MSILYVFLAFAVSLFIVKKSIFSLCDMANNPPVFLFPKSKKQLALEFSVHRNTITKWCKMIGIPRKKLLTPKQLNLFYQEFGLPQLHT